MNNEKFEFTEVPNGSEPMQGEGIILSTGQGFYFRYRSGKASLTISKVGQPTYSIKDSNAAVEYVECLDIDVYSELALEMATSLVRRWLDTYLASL